MTDQQRSDWRKQWAEAEERVRAKVKAKPTRVAHQKAVKPMFDQEHCEGCLILLPRGHVRTVAVDADIRYPSAYRFLCSKCAREVTP